MSAPKKPVIRKRPVKKLSAVAKPAVAEFARVPRKALGKPVETREC